MKLRHDGRAGPLHQPLMAHWGMQRVRVGCSTTRLLLGAPVTLHNEPKGGKLAGPIADKRLTSGQTARLPIEFALQASAPKSYTVDVCLPAQLVHACLIALSYAARQHLHAQRL
jgi:hypothetical protein